MTKNFHTHKKAENANKQLSPPQKFLYASKNAALDGFSFACSFISVLIVYFCFWVGVRFVSWFLGLEVFRKKKNLKLPLYPQFTLLLTCTILTPISRICLYTFIFICNHLWESSFYENLFESFLSGRISSYCVNLFKSLFIVKIFLNPSCLWKFFLIYAHLWESLLLSMFDMNPFY